MGAEHEPGDAIGTVSQGVVTYGVTVVFQTQDERVRPGMSAAAAVVTAVRSDVLLVPNGAVRWAMSARYAVAGELVFTPASISHLAPPRQAPRRSRGNS